MDGGQRTKQRRAAIACRHFPVSFPVWRRLRGAQRYYSINFVNCHPGAAFSFRAKVTSDLYMERSSAFSSAALLAASRRMPLLSRRTTPSLPMEICRFGALPRPAAAGRRCRRDACFRRRLLVCSLIRIEASTLFSVREWMGGTAARECQKSLSGLARASAKQRLE